MDTNDFLDVEPKEWLSLEPPQMPVSALDVDRTNGCFEMMLPMADPCGKCGAFRMLVGDYVCWGFCTACYNLLTDEERMNLP